VPFALSASAAVTAASSAGSQFSLNFSKIVFAYRGTQVGWYTRWPHKIGLGPDGQQERLRPEPSRKEPPWIGEPVRVLTGTDTYAAYRGLGVRPCGNGYSPVIAFLSGESVTRSGFRSSVGHSFSSSPTTPEWYTSHAAVPPASPRLALS
jgi:hypothetical protein